jgi:hypothetical protein
VLERLVWSGHEYDHRPELFSSLQKASKLVSLTLDFSLMTPTDRHAINQPIHLLNPRQYLPPGLQTLRVTDISMDHIYAMLDGT